MHTGNSFKEIEQANFYWFLYQISLLAKEQILSHMLILNHGVEE